MDQLFTGLGIRFRHPEDWELTEQLGETEASITVSSPQTAFWSVTVLRDRPDPLEVLRAAMVAFEDEYDEIDINESEVEIAMRRVVALEIEFVCLELTNTACLRAFQTDLATILVLSQLNDDECDEYQPILEQISESLLCDDDIPALP